MPQRRQLPYDLSRIFEELDAAQAAYEAAAAAERAAGRRRAEAVAAATDAGLTRQQVGDRLGVTRGRVQQILDAVR